jgi:hypothetical protein
VDAAGEDVWSVYPDKDATSVEYNYDATGQSLNPGETYEWRLIAFDPPTSGGPDNYAMATHTFTVEGEGEGKRSKWGPIDFDANGVLLEVDSLKR